MKFILPVVLLFTVAVNSTPLKEFDNFAENLKKERELYPRFVEISDGDETEVRIADLEAPVDFELLERVAREPEGNEYWLYTRANPDVSQNLILNDERSVINSNFDPRKPTVFMVHGWNSNGHREPNLSSRPAFLKKMDCNVISMDWSILADADYVTATWGTPEVGRQLGTFINWLTDFGLDLSQVHLVGYSLGAHLIGSASRQCDRKIGRITGLEPAGPLWTYNYLYRLNKRDAVYVEAMHTDGGISIEGIGTGMGIGTSVGDVDFFPNGGIKQPGCWTNSCNHRKAPAYFAATVSYDHLVGTRCVLQEQAHLNLCFGREGRMGNGDIVKDISSGIYRVNTEAEYPY